MVSARVTGGESAEVVDGCLSAIEDGVEFWSMCTGCCRYGAFQLLVEALEQEGVGTE